MEGNTNSMIKWCFQLRNLCSIKTTIALFSINITQAFDLSIDYIKVVSRKLYACIKWFLLQFFRTLSNKNYSFINFFSTFFFCIHKKLVTVWLTWKVIVFLSMDSRQVFRLNVINCGISLTNAEGKNVNLYENRGLRTLTSISLIMENVSWHFFPFLKYYAFSQSVSFVSSKQKKRKKDPRHSYKYSNRYCRDTKIFFQIYENILCLQNLPVNIKLF